MSMRIVVTGGAGFIGSNLCMKLLRRGDSVLVIDNFCDFYDPNIKRKNIEAVKHSDRHEKLQLCEADIRDFDALDAAFSEFLPDAVVHLAAYAGVRPSIERPSLYYDVNLMGSVQLLDVMKKHGVRRMVFASSSSVYGNNKKVPFSENDPVDHPISPYAATKKAGELLMYTYHKLFGMSVCCLRFFTVYGPRQRPDLAIHKFIRLIHAGQPIQMFGNGSSMRDYTYIDDILDGVVKSLDWTAGENLYDIFNLGESHAVTLSQMIETIERALSKKAIIERLPMQPGDVEQTFADTSHARNEIGYAPQTTFAEGIANYIEWLKQEGLLS